MPPGCTCWTYHQGGDDWSCDDFNEEGSCSCGGGVSGGAEMRQMSPIDITCCSEAADPLHLQMGCSTNDVSITNTGTTAQYQVNDPSESNHLGWFSDGETMHFVRYLRFHAPAEHRVKGRMYDMELELVAYSSCDPCPCCPPTAVLSVFWKKGVHNAFLSRLQWGSPLFRTLSLPEPHQECGSEQAVAPRPVPQIDLHWLNQLASPSYYRYTGSMTSPPCTQPVERFVLCRPQQLSSQQLYDFYQLLRSMPRTERKEGGHANHRHVQPLHPQTAVKCYYS